MIIVLIFYFMVNIIDFYPIIKQKKTKELIINVIFLIPSLVFVFIFVNGIVVKSWLIIIWEFLKKIGITY